ncbi:MAG: DUF1343 domain-containing protein [Bacteriovoracaceae bacterium]|nr:DUF1343 domain-containing protein [Bacteriovoracaceae bacterium]
MKKLILSLLLAFPVLSFAYDFGIDRLTESEVVNLLQDKKLAVLTHSAGVDKTQTHLIDTLFKNFTLVKIFAPEHGLRSMADEWVGDGVDEQTGLPVISLYKRGSRAPSLQDLKGLDAIVVDLQDVGVRYYTYFSTIAEVMKAASAAKIEVIILDRPNLLGGKIEGETLTQDLAGGFTSYHTVPTRHGMTLGELAQMINVENKMNTQLKIVAARGWKRESLWDKWDRQWISPSPALVEPTQIPLYALWGTLENFNLAVGRGLKNDLAFKVIGAPWITPEKAILLRDHLNALQFPGLSFETLSWNVTRATYDGKTVNGVKITGDFSLTRTDEFTYKVAQTLIELFPNDLNIKDMSARSYGSVHLVESIKKMVPWSEESKRIDLALEAFKKRRLPYLIY